MNETADTVDSRLDELLGVVEAERERRCRELLDEARSEAREIVQRAFRETRARVQQVIAEERASGRARVATTRAHIETRNRHRRHQVIGRLLTRALERLDEAIAARWRDTDARQQWVESAVTHALERLPRREWRIVHAPDWPEGERESVRQRIREQTGVDPQIEPSERISAGLRIHAQGSTLDATPRGLMSDRTVVQARLLVHLVGGEPDTSEPTSS